VLVLQLYLFQLKVILLLLVPEHQDNHQEVKQPVIKEVVQVFQQLHQRVVEVDKVEILQVPLQVQFQQRQLQVKEHLVVQAVVQETLIVVQNLNILVQVIIHQSVLHKVIQVEEVLGQHTHHLQVVHRVEVAVVEQELSEETLDLTKQVELVELE
jgi:hypothetical protein